MRSSVPADDVLSDRARLLREGAWGPGAVVYWMSRDQRAADNWALLFAQRLALERRRPLVVAFHLADAFLGAGPRQAAFMLAGLEETAADLAAKNIPFVLLTGDLAASWRTLARRVRPAAWAGDFDPLRIKRERQAAVLPILNTPAWEVDAHNVVPCWQASPKAEWDARTFRPKLHRQLRRFLTPFPRLARHPWALGVRLARPDWGAARRRWGVNRDAASLGIEPGSAAGRAAMRRFLARGLAEYGEARNDPTRSGQSGLSPYLHFGQLAPQRVAWEAAAARTSLPGQDAFLEELLVRRELADNYCHYRPDYDRVGAFPAWAAATLRRHAADPRPYLYRPERLEAAETHDELWNAAQRQLVRSGRMHGYLRMYWAKKILEWTESPAAALAEAIHLNDRYALDGRDPNGYAGIAWSLGGVHDRAWGERPVFGKVRYMSAAGCARKFKLAAYLSRWAEA